MNHGANKEELKTIEGLVKNGTSVEEISRLTSISVSSLDSLIKSFGFKPAWVEQELVVSEPLETAPSVVEKPKPKRTRRKRK